MLKFWHMTFTASDSRQIDLELGYNIEAIESELLKAALSKRPGGHLWSLGQGLHDGNQTWIGLDPQVIQTPYNEIKEMFELISLTPKARVIDLGAGYGRMGIYLHALDPEIIFTGFELVPERVQEGMRIFQKIGTKSLLIEADLAHQDFKLPEADVYFLYDFGEVGHIRKILDQLSDKANKKFYLIARGKGSRSLLDLEYPWLSDVHEVIRRENFAIYKSFES